MPDWLVKDYFLQQELFKFALSILTGIFLALLVQVVLARRDRRIQLLERQMNQLRELRMEVIDIYNTYYRVRKRYTTVRDTVTSTKVRNTYLKENPSRAIEIFDNLIADCISLEARYFTLLRQIDTSFPREWEGVFKMLMSSPKKKTHDTIKNEGTLQSYFMSVRHCIEQNVDISDDIKETATENLHQVLRAFNSIELKLIGKYQE